MNTETAAAPEISVGPTKTGLNWPLVFLAYVVIAAIFAGKAIFSAKTVALINDTDDAMRLTVVHDLLNGQAWWDHLQYRLNPPGGTEIHWSRLVDAPIAGLQLLFRPFGGLADTLTVYVWPLLLLFGLLALTAQLAYRLAGREAVLAALLLPAVSPALVTEFSPGRIDHDSVQILLLLVMVWSAIESIARPRWAVLAGLAGAVSLAIGIEGLPSVVCTIIAVALIWVVRPDRAAAMRNYGLTLALGTIAAQVNQYPPSRWFEAACDEISFTYVAFGVGVGVALLLLSLLPLARRPAWLRLLVGGVLGGALALVLIKAFPLCLKGPYAALDPWLVTNWLNTIAEAKPVVWDSIRGAPAPTLAGVIPALLGLAVIAWRVWREPRDRGPWLILELFLAIATAVMFAQVRGARLAVPLALPAAGWLIATARQRYVASRKLLDAAGLFASWLGFAGLVLAVIVLLVTRPDESKADAFTVASTKTDLCLMPAAYAGLNALPPTRLMAPVDLGAHILLYTRHSVIGAPYHRNQQGVLDTYHFLNNSITEARQLLADRGVTVVVICPGMPELRGLDSAAPDSFVKLLADNQLPAWLQPISAPDDVLKLYRVAPQTP